MVALPDEGHADAVTRLRTIEEIARAANAEVIATEAADLAGRVAEGRFFVACLGQFKRGKSTVLNALLGEPVLPTGVVPVTSAVTIVRQGSPARVRVRLRSGASEDTSIDRLREFVTESGNPDNRQGIAAVEVFHPSGLLRDGLCLVDTPGLGSASPLATAVTRAFVPHVDAALVVIGADPPLTGDELHLIGDVSAETQKFIYAINKADKLTDADLAEVLVFTQRVLMEHTGNVPDNLFIISASERLNTGRPTRDWARLEHALTTFGQDAKASLIAQRIDRVQHRLATQLVQAIDLAVEALVVSTNESDRRLEQLQQWLKDAERALTDLGVLLTAEQQAIARTLRDELNVSLAAKRRTIAIELEAAVERAIKDRGPNARQHAFTVAQDIAKRAVRQELETEETRAAKSYQAATERFAELANGLLNRLAVTEARLGDLPPITAPDTLGGKRRSYFTELMRLTSRTPWEVIVDALGSDRARRDRVLASANRYLDRLLETNTSRVAGDLEDRLAETRRVLESEVRARLTALVSSATRGIERARELRASGQAAVHDELERLRGLRDCVESAI